MNLLQSINKTLKEEAQLQAEVREFIAEMETPDETNLFRLNELFGGNKKKEEMMARRRRAIERGKIGSVERNKEGEWQGGVMGEGRLAELVKLFGKPVFDNGKPPRKPEGMSPEDYKIWIKGFAQEERTVDTGPAVGPAVGDVVRDKGVMYRIDSQKGLSSSGKNKDGDVKSFNWDSLKKSKEVDGIQVFTVM